MTSTTASVETVTIPKAHKVPSTILEQKDETRSVLVQHQGTTAAWSTCTSTQTSHAGPGRIDPDDLPLFVDYLLLSSYHCFTKLQIFMAENKDSLTDKEKELLVDDTSSEEETVDPEL